MSYIPFIKKYCTPEQVSIIFRLVTDVMTENEGIMAAILLDDEEDNYESQ